MPGEYSLKAGLFSLLAAALLLFACSEPSSPGAGEGSRSDTMSSHTPLDDLEGDYIIIRSERVPLLVSLTEIGILAQEGTAIERVERFAASRSWVREATYSGKIFVYRLEARSDRAEIVRLAREIRAAEPELIQQAGLVVRVPDADSPMIVADQLVVQFRDDTREALSEIAERNARLIRKNRHVPGQFLLTVPGDSSMDALTMSHAFEGSPLVSYAHPDFIVVLVYGSNPPADPLFDSQWHLENEGPFNGLLDADIDILKAWDLLPPPSELVEVKVAVIDLGFEPEHPDLAGNLWTNPQETLDGSDNDGNGIVDDIHGASFSAFDNPTAQLADPQGRPHGTQVAGLIAAKADNTLGVAGVCPNCRLILIKNSDWVSGQVAAVNYAVEKGADIVNSSWHYAIGSIPPNSFRNAVSDAASNARSGKGLNLFWSAYNANLDQCGVSRPGASYIPEGVAVSASTNFDEKKLDSGKGNCIDLLAPSNGGTLYIGTTDLTDTAGTNNLLHEYLCAVETPEIDYTLCFGGTSASAPIVAGVAGLVLGVRPDLTRLQVQRLLQDTADKIEPSAASYNEETGFSQPPSGVATHAYGRVNAFESVRVVAPQATGGRAGVDIFFRDNILDWGNTERGSGVRFENPRGFIPWWNSVDIKVDAPSYDPPPIDSAQFDAFGDENPVAGATNRVFVRVHNRGPDAAALATVKLHWAFAGAGLPALPGDFWTTFPADSTDTTKWHPLPAKTITHLGYSGASVAGVSGDGSGILQFDFQAPTIIPGTPQARHYCLLAIVDSPQDQVPRTSLFVNELTPSENNVTLRNVALQDPVEQLSGGWTFLVRNPYPMRIQTLLRVNKPPAWHFTLEDPAVLRPFFLSPGEEKLIRATYHLALRGRTGEIVVTQHRLGPGLGRLTRGKVMGGMTFRFRPAPETQ